MDMDLGFPRSKKKICALCGAEVHRDQYLQHIRGCIYRFEFDPNKCPDPEKVKVALRLTKKHYGEEIYEEAKKGFESML